MLHPVHRDRANMYCGPWALGALTGAPPAVVRACVYQAFEESAAGVRDRAQHVIKGLYTREMTRVLELLGHRAEQVAEWQSWHLDETREQWYVKARRPTLGEWCTAVDRHDVPGDFLVHCGWHYVTACRGTLGLLLSDNRQRTPIPVPWRTFRGLGQRMWEVWSVTPGTRP